MAIIFLIVGCIMAIISVGFLLAHIHDKREYAITTFHYNILMIITLIIAVCFLILAVLYFVGVLK